MAAVQERYGPKKRERIIRRVGEDFKVSLALYSSGHKLKVTSRRATAEIVYDPCGKFAVSLEGSAAVIFTASVADGVERAVELLIDAPNCMTPEEALKLMEAYLEEG